MSSRKDAKEQGRKIAILLAMIALIAIIFVPIVQSDWILESTGPYDRRFVWEFNNPSNYTLNNTVIENGTLELDSTPFSINLTSQQDFENATLWNLNSSSSPGDVRLEEVQPNMIVQTISLNDSDLEDTYITNRTSMINFGGMDNILVGNDTFNYTYRSLIRFNSSLLSDLIPWDATLINTSLSLYRISGNYTGSIEARLGANNWTEGDGIWNGTLGQIWVNETEGIRRTNEPIIMDIPIGMPGLTDPVKELILFDENGIEYPSRILNESYDNGNLSSVRIGFPADCEPFESKYFVLRYFDNLTSVPSYRENIVAEPAYRGGTLLNSQLCAPALADLNLDGVLDLILYDKDSRTMNAYNGSQITPPSMGIPLWNPPYFVGEDLQTSLTVADIDSDDDVEILYAARDEGFKVLRSNGLFLFSGVVAGLDKHGVAQPAVADINLDGTQEILISLDDRTIAAVSGTDGSLVWRTAGGLLSGRATAIAVGEFTETVGLEIALAIENGAIYLLNATGGMEWENSSISSFNYGKSFAAAEIDNDTYADIIVGADNGGGSVFAVSGKNGTLLWEFRDYSARYGDGLAIGDINNDGKNEAVVLAREPRKVIAIANNGTMIWEFDLSNESRGSITLADYDGDGNLEIFVGDRQGAIQIINASGNIVYTLQATSPGTRIDNPVIIADIDGDTMLDIVISSDDITPIFEIPGFSLDWRMKSKNSWLECSISELNSHDAVNWLEKNWSSSTIPIWAVNWTHASDLNRWILPGGDFNISYIDLFNSSFGTNWEDINITQLISQWLQSDRTDLSALFLLPEENTSGVVGYASTEHLNISLHPHFTVRYNYTRYISYGILVSDILNHSNRSYWTAIEVNATTNNCTNISFEIRGGNSTDPDDGTWNSWKMITFAGNSTSSQINERCKYIQVRANLSTNNSSFTPVLHAIRIDGIEYCSSGTLETEDATTVEDIRQWNESWANYIDNGGQISLNYSTDSGMNWYSVPISGDISSANQSTKKIRLKIELIGESSASTPLVFNMSASYSIFSVVETPPYIDPIIPDQSALEDAAPWSIDLSPYLHDLNDPQSLLRWYAVNESFVTVLGENSTGNMWMTLTIPQDVFGNDTITFVLLDSSNNFARQDINITVTPIDDYPSIAPAIPNQLLWEDSPPWPVNLAPYIHDVEDPQSMLKWYVINEDFVTVLGENVTGNMWMNLSIPMDVFGKDIITFILEDSSGQSTSQQINITVISVNDPPQIADIADFSVHFGESYEFNFRPYLSDKETPRDLLNLTSVGINSTYVTLDGFLATFLLPEFLNGTQVEFTFAVDDGESSSSTSFSVLVSENYPPRIFNPMPDVTLYQGETRINELNLFDYFADIDDGTMFFVAGNIYVQVIINQQTGQIDFIAPNNWYGAEEVTFKAIDPRNARAEDTINVTVLKVVQPPEFKQIPNLVVRFATEYILDLRPYITDPDTPIEDLIFSSDLSAYISFSNGKMKVLLPDVGMVGTTYAVNLTVDDGDATDTCMFNITVGNNYPPIVGNLPEHSFAEDAPIDYPTTSYLNVFFFDAENLTSLDFYAWSWELNVSTSISDENGNIKIKFNQTPNWYGKTHVTIRATDYYGAFAEETIPLTIIPVNDLPVIDAIDTITVIAGIETIVNITANISDVETPIEMLLLKTDMPEYVSGISGHLIINFPQDFLDGEESRTEKVALFVRDLHGGESFVILTIIIEEPPGDPSQQIYFWWIITLIATTASLLGFFIARKVIKGPFVIHEMILIHNTGLLMARYSKSDTVKVDDDVFSGMLTAVLDFVDDAFRQDSKEMKRFDFKDYVVALQRGKNAYTVTAFSGIPSENFDMKMADLMKKIEKIYGYRIERYSGDAVKELAGIEIIFNEFIEENSKILNEKKMQKFLNKNSQETT